MALDYNKLSNRGKRVYDRLGEENTIRIMVHAFSSGCIRAEILGIRSSDPRFAHLQRIYREEIFGIFEEHTSSLPDLKEYVFLPISDEELRAIEFARTKDSNRKILAGLAKMVGS